MVKKAKMTVYCCGMFLDSILSKRAEFSICRSNFSQGPYSNIIHTKRFDSSFCDFDLMEVKLKNCFMNDFRGKII